MFEQIGLGTILKRYRLVVPPNQRDYSWTEQHVKTLFYDFARSISDNEENYFVGTVVGVEKKANQLEIVDGQQRLSTTVIFLCELKNYLNEISESGLADSVKKDFLVEFDRSKKEEVVKMELNVADNEYFKSMIYADSQPPKKPVKPSHDLIADTFRLSKEQVKSIVAAFNKKDQADQLNKWIDFIEHKAVVMLVTVSDKTNAYKMFETLNDRGLKTSQADLVKNYLFGESNSRSQEAQQKWGLMKGALDSVYDEDVTVRFLRHVLNVLRGHTREQEVFIETQKIAKGTTKALSFLDNLERFSTTYVAITNPEHEIWNKYPDSMRGGIKTLNLINIRPFQPLLLALTEKTKPKDMNIIVMNLISLGVRLLIASRTTTGSVEEALSKAANMVYSNKAEDWKSLKKVLENITPNNEKFCQAFETATVSQAKFARYYLRTLEMEAKGEPNPLFIPNDDKEVVNLEHILPERPGKNWPAFTQDAVGVYSKRIGNFVLLNVKPNSDLKSADFKTKKIEYAKNTYKLTKEVCKYTNWTETEIGERQKRLAALAIKAWPI